MPKENVKEPSDREKMEQELCYKCKVFTDPGAQRFLERIFRDYAPDEEDYGLYPAFIMQMDKLISRLRAEMGSEQFDDDDADNMEDEGHEENFLGPGEDDEELPEDGEKFDEEDDEDYNKKVKDEEKEPPNPKPKPKDKEDDQEEEPDEEEDDEPKRESMFEQVKSAVSARLETADEDDKDDDDDKDKTDDSGDLPPEKIGDVMILAKEIRTKFPHLNKTDVINISADGEINISVNA